MGAFLFQTYDDNGNVIAERIRPLKMRQTYRQEMKWLIELCGFELLELYGDYNGEKASGNAIIKNLIWVLKKKITADVFAKYKKSIYDAPKAQYNGNRVLYSRNMEKIMITNITPENAKQIMNNSPRSAYILLDVRDRDEYTEGHIADASLIPLAELENRASSELPDKEKTVLVYCRSGKRAGKAAALLDQLGYSDVRNFGGVLDWPFGLIK